ncbi:hypothetical protein FOZ76_02690 [Verticiella sediminum]|uniref:Caspase family protein n=1 Tax=Verticiella sediminum TaxID=1247510 RepID=A0A556B0F0_9BURK|nr:caspase family protein [Verticiella sediminum]TSH98671.1 hypothetical protein FOZ76_02690 [Verticiella sediminum]
MTRAIVLIGVSKVRGHGFPPLKGVGDAIARLRDWAHSQGIPDVIALTDEGTQEVTAGGIKKAIFGLLDDRDDLEQLIVYFSGHGVVRDYREFWLLSRAPYDVDETVNLTGSVALARAGRVPHVVFISDACRTPTNTLQTSFFLNGSHIFPSIGNPDTTQAADVFYATQLGAPALEVAEDGENYVAVYSEVLAEALNGRPPTLIQNGLLRPRPLGDWLMKAVPRSLADKKLRVPPSQRPYADIASGDEVWLARFHFPPQAAGQAPPNPDAGPDTPDTDADGQATDADALAPDELLVAEARFTEMLGRPFELPRDLADLLPKSRWPFGVSSGSWRPLGRDAGPAVVRDGPFERHVGFLVSGREVREASCPGEALRVERGLAGSAIVMESLQRPAEVLIEFDDGSGVLLPALPGQLAVLPFEDGRPGDFRYEPVDTAPADASRFALDGLRTAACRVSAWGGLALDRQGATQLMARLLGAPSIDPVLAIYAACAFERIGRLDWIRTLQDEVAARWGLRLFDLALLSREFLRDAPPVEPVLPSVPMLAQNWVYLQALHPGFPPELAASLRGEIHGPLWARYTPRGVHALQTWLVPDADAVQLQPTP